MKHILKRKLRCVLFILGGALAGLAYYYLIGCATGSCPITANPITTMLYTGLVGWLLSGIFKKESDCGCNT